MFGHPGLLVRGKKCVKKTFDHLSNESNGFLDEITPNCHSFCNSRDHFDICFDHEADIILVYPGSDKLHIVLIEVKRPYDSENISESGFTTIDRNQSVKLNKLCYKYC